MRSRNYNIVILRVVPSNVRKIIVVWGPWEARTVVIFALWLLIVLSVRKQKCRAVTIKHMTQEVRANGLGKTTSEVRYKSGVYRRMVERSRQYRVFTKIPTFSRKSNCRQAAPRCGSNCGSTLGPRGVDWSGVPGRGHN